MRHYVIIAQSRLASAALKHVAEMMLDGEVAASDSHVQVVYGAAAQEPHELFRDLAAWLESYVARECIPLDEVTVLLDSVAPDALSPLGTDSWNTTMAMLILAFPEVPWVFATSNTTASEEEWRKAVIGHRLCDLFTYSGTPLFDGNGLRNWVKNVIPSGSKAVSFYHIDRGRVAATIDEEDSYAFLHAYAAYRFGYRAHCLTTLSEAEAVFGKHSNPCAVDLTFEDLYLAFPDQAEGALHLSHLWAHKADEEGESRRDRLPLLEDCAHRIIVTGAHTRASDPERWQKNAFELEAWRRRNEKRCYKIIGKPTSGIFDLWEQAGLRLWGDWPPKPDKAVIKWPRHSAPGRLKAVAELLLQRASRLAEDAKRVPEIVRVAVLARDAMELIGHRTPTLAAEALALTHEMEVKAECEFAGVQYHFEVAKRLRDIERESQSMSHWIDPSRRNEFVLNSQAAVVTRLVRIFREYGQFDEEQLCLVKVRELNRKLLVSRKLWLKPAEPLMWYLELLLRSLPHFFGAILIWLLGLSGLFFADSLRFDDLANGLSFARIYDASWVAFQTFFSVQPPQPPTGFPAPSTGLVAFAMLAGVTHIGVFISHMYAMISRR